MDPSEEIKKLKAAEQNQPALWPMALFGIVVLFVVSSLWGWLLMQDNIQPLPTPIVTSAWQATRPLLPTPTLAPTRPRATPTRGATTTAVRPANTAAPSATVTVAATYTPYPTFTAAPTYTPYPTPTDAPTATATATDTPTPLPTASPTPTTQPTGTATAAPIIPAPETAVSGSSGGWQQFILNAGMILVLIMAALLLYVEATTIRYRVRSAATRPSPPTPASPTPPTKATPPRELRRVQPSSRRVEPVELVELEPVQGVQPVQLPFSKDRPPTAAEKAFIRKRYAETGNLTAICFECYNSKGGKVWDWVKEAIEEQGGETAVEPKQVEAAPRRQIFINTAQGRRGLHS